MGKFLFPLIVISLFVLSYCYGPADSVTSIPPLDQNDYGLVKSIPTSPPILPAPAPSGSVPAASARYWWQNVQNPFVVESSQSGIHVLPNSNPSSKPVTHNGVTGVIYESNPFLNAALGKKDQFNYGEPILPASSSSPGSVDYGQYPSSPQPVTPGPTVTLPTVPTSPPYTGETVRPTPYPGCPAALKCVPDNYCSTAGVITDSPIELTPDVILNRVPVMACLDVPTGIIGKCCRDPNYKDPWPENLPHEHGHEHEHEHEHPDSNLIPTDNNLKPTPGYPSSASTVNVIPINSFKPTGDYGAVGVGNNNQPQPQRPELPSYQPQQPTYNPNLPSSQPSNPTPLSPSQSTGPPQPPSIPPNPAQHPQYPNYQPSYQPTYPIHGPSYGPSVISQQPLQPPYVGGGPQQPGYPQVPEVPVQPPQLPNKPPSYPQLPPLSPPTSTPPSSVSYPTLPPKPEYPSSTVLIPSQPAYPTTSSPPSRPSYSSNPTPPTSYPTPSPTHPSSPSYPKPPVQHPPSSQPSYPNQLAYPSQPTNPNLPPSEPLYPNQPPSVPSYPSRPPTNPNQQPSLPSYPSSPPSQPSYPGPPPSQPSYPSPPTSQPSYPSSPSQPPYQPSYPLQPIYPPHQPSYPVEIPYQPGYPQYPQQPGYPEYSQYPQYPQSQYLGYYPVQPSYPEGVGYPQRFQNQDSVILKEFSSVCGIRKDDGTTYGRAPWHATVYSNRNKDLICAGAIVSENAVLTTAHCLDHSEAETTEVKLGPQGKVYKVAAIARHSQYDSVSFSRDLAVVFLKEPIHFDKYVMKICLPTTFSQIKSGDKECYVSTLAKEFEPKTLETMPVEVFSYNDCEVKLKNTYLGKYFVLNDSFSCVSSPSDKELCSVKTGSPIACKKVDGSYELFGIKSWDLGCQQYKSSAVFSNFDIIWVQNTLASPISKLVAEEKESQRKKFQGESLEGVNLNDKPAFALGYGKK